MAFVLKRTGLTAAGLALLVALVGWYSHGATKESVRQALLGEVTLLAEHAARSLQGIDLTLQEIVRSVEADWRAGRLPGEGSHAVLRLRGDGLPQVSGLMLIDREGLLLADQLTRRPREGLSLADTSYFRSHRDDFQPGRLFLGEPLRGEGDSRSFFTASYALRDPQDDFGGVLVAIFDPFYYRHTYSQFEQRVSPRDVALVDRNGIILASSADFAVAVGVPLGAETFQNRYLPEIGGGEILGITLPASGERHLAVMVEVPGYDFFGFVGMPEALALRGWTRLLTGMLLASAVALIGVAGASFGIWRREAARRAAFDAMEQAHSDAREARDRAEAANAAKSRFLAHISHELRTPLNAILGFSEVIRDGILGDDRARHKDYAGLIHKSGRHLLQIINDLLDLSRIEAGRWEVKLEAIPVGELFEAAQLLTSQDFVHRGLTLRRSHPPDLPPLLADDRAVRQMLVNLLSNACKFSAAGQEIHLLAEQRSDGGLDLSVADEGPGIAEERLATLFQPFSQVDGLISNEQHGTGLGLPLVKSLMDLHGGEVVVETADGLGTKVTLAFPPQSGAPGRPAPRAAQPEASPDPLPESPTSAAPKSPVELTGR